ncbi:hypothetical protein [Actinoalloteichus hymeniacidonis]|uniref:DUF600 family protein n=1 Tax=Actinoalloteichus hymeniacidonis TaxID=340345 RepID=A0AAC9N0R9_9PSEU|nr:hypothetical protein [Actinoalloteichus hymeniacidonis]AOS65685.1 hypothetical protein TL08_24535 [Actinoalloteichus hymeniacidonis]MBB5906225.1 hypothetical protein [Actinoalloteichus hymeniacidonis]
MTEHNGGEPLVTNEQREIIREIERSLRASAPPDWLEISLHYRATVEIGEVDLHASTTSGEITHWDHPIECTMLLDHLREEMRRAKEGTWFTASCVINRSGNCTMDFDYNSEPSWHTPIPPSAYLSDLQRFPRSEEHTPPWLREQRDTASSQRVPHLHDFSTA